MRLKNISYEEHENTDRHWHYNDFNINNINLLVGKNASGKTRILNSIFGLVNILRNEKAPFDNGKYIAVFTLQEEVYSYKVDIESKIIKNEKLEINGALYLERRYTGEGSIRHEEMGRMAKFKIPNNQLAISRKDEIQHPKLSNLHSWAESVRFFSFAQDKEKESVSIESNANFFENENKLNSLAINIFKMGEKKYGKAFTDQILNNMADIGYYLDAIRFGPMPNIKIISLPLPAELSGIIIKEKDCNFEIGQFQMSNGMFRALAILIHFNFYNLEKNAGTILIDDIGEGLDFERSSKLTQILVNGAENSDIQLIMSTNDKFIMNSIDLKYWQIISRKSSNVKINNIHTVPKAFENFKFTGLNNFEFYTYEFLNDYLEGQI